MISGKVKYFDMDYFGSHQAIAELDNGYTIHMYYEGGSDRVDIYHGNDIVYRRRIPHYSGKKYEYIHLCRGYISIKCLEWIEHQGRYFTGKIPHEAGRICTVNLNLVGAES